MPNTRETQKTLGEEANPCSQSSRRSDVEFVAWGEYSCVACARALEGSATKRPRRIWKLAVGFV